MNVEEKETIGTLWFRVPGVDQHVNEMADEMQKRFPGLYFPHRSVFGLASALARSSFGFAPLRWLIDHRPDIFNDYPTVSALRERVLQEVDRAERPAVEPPPVSEDRILQAVDRIFTACPDIGGAVWKCAYYCTILDTATDGCPTVPWSDDAGRTSRVKKLRELHPDHGVQYVLEFLERIAAELAKTGGTDSAERIRRECDDLVYDVPALRDTLRARREYFQRLPRMDRIRPHLLIQILPTDDNDQGTPAACFELTAWRYFADAFGTSPVLRDRQARAVGEMRELSRAEIPQEVARLVAEFPSETNAVIEFMRDYRELNEPVETWPDAGGCAIGKRFGVVVRPSEAALDVAGGINRSASFKRWRRLLLDDPGPFHPVAYAQLVEKEDSLTGLPDHCTAVEVRAPAGRPLETTDFVKRLVHAGFPVASWCRNGGESMSQQVDEVSFRTPNWLRNWRAREDSVDFVLMWDNPHWVPAPDDDAPGQYRLVWREVAP